MSLAERMVPERVGAIHFVGIGGIGMSGLAKILHTLGYYVQGSDAKDSSALEELRSMGITVFVGHKAENVANVGLLVLSSAIGQNNPEFVESERLGIPMIKRAEMLAEIMRLKNSIAIAGTHGKTTTTSIVANLLEQGGIDPTVVNGGIINAYKTNAKMGKGKWVVVEADESDGSFKYLRPTMVAVTNVDPEHLDHYGSFAALQNAFQQFILSIPFYGMALICHDHPILRSMIKSLRARRMVTYGLEDGADIQAINLRTQEASTLFDVRIKGHLVSEDFLASRGEGITMAVDKNDFVIQSLELAMVGNHNVQNALVAVGFALELGISLEDLGKSMRNFMGVKRRFTPVGEVGGIRIIDDYAHHPVEIAAVIAAAKLSGRGKTIGLWQPHRYSRVQHLLRDFCASLAALDHVIVLPIYGAGEQSLPHLTHDYLGEQMRSQGGIQVHMATNVEEIADILANIAGPGDIVLAMGAGDITATAANLPLKLEEAMAGRQLKQTA